MNVEGIGPYEGVPIGWWTLKVLVPMRGFQLDEGFDPYEGIPIGWWMLMVLVPTRGFQLDECFGPYKGVPIGWWMLKVLVPMRGFQLDGECWRFWSLLSTRPSWREGDKGVPHLKLTSKLNLINEKHLILIAKVLLAINVKVAEYAKNSLSYFSHLSHGRSIYNYKVTVVCQWIH